MYSKRNISTIKNVIVNLITNTKKYLYEILLIQDYINMYDTWKSTIYKETFSLI